MQYLNLTQSFNPRVWLVATSFVLLQFFLQLSSGIVIGSIMHEMQLSAFSAGMLSSSFYFIYTALQIPVGMFCDRYNPRPILTATALLCCLGCFMFASSHSLLGLYLGRVCIGVGSSFAFVGLTHMVRQHYPAKQFALLIGTCETLSFLVSVFGIVGMGELLASYGWRSFIYAAAFVALTIACLSWNLLPNEDKSSVLNQRFRHQLFSVITSKFLWINGLIIGLTFTIVTVYGALWAVPFLQIKLGCSMRQASIANAMFFLGTGLSCPLFGAISAVVARRKWLIISSCTVTAGLFLLILFIPSQQLMLIGSLMFLLGLCCGAYILAYPISNELAPADSISTSSGFTNTLAILTTPLLQPFVGYLLVLSNANENYSLRDYQHALLILPICLLTACILVLFLPEKSKTLHSRS